jgi:hypothetical protein
MVAYVPRGSHYATGGVVFLEAASRSPLPFLVFTSHLVLHFSLDFNVYFLFQLLYKQQG